MVCKLNKISQRYWLQKELFTFQCATACRQDPLLFFSLGPIPQCHELQEKKPVTQSYRAHRAQHNTSEWEKDNFGSDRKR